MKIFRLRLKRSARYLRSFVSWFMLALFFASCATIRPQFGETPPDFKDDFRDNRKLSHTFYLIGDAGNWDQAEKPEVFRMLESQLKAADTAATLIFLGDNIYPLGMPKKGDPDYESARRRLKIQTDLATSFPGRTIFIPGNHDWYHELEGLKEQEKAVVDALGKGAFLPRKSCGITSVDINEQTAMIVLDSEWFLQDWDHHPNINEDCDIKTRDMFFAELENKLGDFQNKTVILAMHHPLFSGGPHGGEYSAKKHLFPLKYKVPLPVIGTVMNVLRRTSGAVPEDLQNKKYNDLVKRIRVMIQGRENVVVVSGHDHNLQYIDKDGIKQVVSGAGSKSEAARALGPKDFSTGNNGFAVLKVLRNGAAGVDFFSPSASRKDGLLFSTQPIYERPKPDLKEYPKTFPTTKDTSVYTLAMTKKSGIYRFFWGKHYREYYGKPIHVPQVSLDTLFGGVKPTQAGGGNQSRSLRIETEDGREYVMRALKKSATRFIQSAAFKDQSVEKDFRNTYTETFLMDFYTTAHPYTPFAAANLAGYLNINHSNPKLFYIPKQNRLELYNEEFGDELFLVEERPMKQFRNLKSFGQPDDFVNTEDLLANLRDDPKYRVDQDSYIRARLFDMLIGDWDRHSDQWRWAEHKENGKVIYRPIPRDRDQAFTKIDGVLLSVLMNIPALRHMKKYENHIKNVRWFNRSAYDLDLALLPEATQDDWLRQARYIQEHLSDAEIDKAFEAVPKEVRDATIDEIKTKLRSRQKQLDDYARKYYKVLMETVVIAASEKRDRIQIRRDGKTTRVKVSKVGKDAVETVILDRTYNTSETKELWIYGLGGDDVFDVKGKPNRTRLRLLGGPDNDTYATERGRRVHVYDFNTPGNDYAQARHASRTISNDYDLNTYDYKRPKYNFFAGYPLVWFNPDDGVKVGAVLNYTVNGFHRNPFTQKHSVGANYYFATGGYELTYKGVFPRAVGGWNFQVNARYTSANFSQNFFGFGNETPNYDEALGMNYNRVKVSVVSVAPAMEWKGEQGGSALVHSQFERVRVDEAANRFIGQPGAINPDVFHYKNFMDFNAEYRFENYDNSGFPTLGFLFYAKGGYKWAIDNSQRSFPYAESAFGLNYKLIPSGRVVLASQVKGKMLFGNQYEFYQAATVGGDADLRGFRNQRYAGKSSFYHTTDVRWNIFKWKTTVVPLNIGVLAGFDWGRVWQPGDESRVWHQSGGAGLWVSGLNLVTGRVSYFYSGDGGRLFVGVGFGF